MDFLLFYLILLTLIEAILLQQYLTIYFTCVDSFILITIVISVIFYHCANVCLLVFLVLECLDFY